MIPYSPGGEYSVSIKIMGFTPSTIHQRYVERSFKVITERSVSKYLRKKSVPLESGLLRKQV